MKAKKLINLKRVIFKSTTTKPIKTTNINI